MASIDASPVLVPTQRLSSSDPDFIMGSNTLKILGMNREVEQKLTGATTTGGGYKVKEGVFGDVKLQSAGPTHTSYHYSTTSSFVIKAEDVVTSTIHIIKVQMQGRSDVVLDKDDLIEVHSVIGGAGVRGTRPFVGAQEWTPAHLVEVEGRQVLLSLDPTPPSFLLPTPWPAILGALAGFVGGFFALAVVKALGFLRMASGCLGCVALMAFLVGGTVAGVMIVKALVSQQRKKAFLAWKEAHFTSWLAEQDRLHA